MSFALLASPSNNVEVAFGCDANGTLEDSDTAFAIGWDCGEWFFRDVAADVADSCGASSFALAGYVGLVRLVVGV